MEIFLIRLLQLMLSLSILVLIHELGHLMFARLFGIRVEKFYLFFDPWFHLFEFKPKNSHTTYGVGWLPFGGYCKIAGMIDESFDTEQMKQEPQPWEFRTKPAWQRLLVMIGGVLMNFLLALFIYAMILFHWGDSYVAVKDMTMGMEFNEHAESLGFRDGDVLVGTDRGDFKDFGADMFRNLAKANTCHIVRHGKPMDISLPGGIDYIAMLKNDPMFARPYLPAQVDSVLQGSPAEAVGLKAGHQILAINGHDASTFYSCNNEMGRLADVMTTALTPEDSLRIRTIQLVTLRDGVRDTATAVLTPELMLGFIYTPMSKLYKTTKQEYRLLGSFPAGVSYGLNVLKGYVGDFEYLASPEGAKSLGGFGTIGSLFPGVWDWYAFWKMTAFLSIILAFMNILPIPVLDGGYVLFLIYEIITRRKPSDTFMVRANYVGFGILVLLMVLANLNDILRWLGYM